MAREIDFHSVAFPDGHRGHDVQELLENLRRRLRSALREPLAEEVGTACVKGARCSGFPDCSQSADGERHAEDAEIVVVDLIPQPGVADLVEPLELIETDGIPVRHEHSMEHDGQTGLAEGVHLLRLTEQLRACGYYQG